MITLLKKIKYFIYDQLVQVKVIKGQNDYEKFIILSDYRSGSNLLMNLLKSHPNALCYSELFYGKKIFWASAIYGKSELDKKAVELRKINPFGFLDKYCYRNYETSLKAVGFKLMYFDIFKNKNINLTELLKYYPDIKIIHLKRKNHLERYVSDMMVKSTGEAVAVNEKDWKKISSSVNKIHISPKICEDDLIWRKEMDKKLEDIFHETTNQRIIIYYEDLNIDRHFECNRILSFLKIDKLKLETTQIKQNKKKLSDRIENYSELKDYFNNTEWSIYFKD